ncbi:MAG: MarR family transcriptional regulator [Candidatus Marinimicrobia bacterium]|nr:MarR family transcriptional regulator [Candidatus Neomarinimicrobiota bacterium]MBL7031336.1 MarR family transcriptional regulator [Candidatus Neomarinimicrobiota bacterium]
MDDIQYSLIEEFGLGYKRFGHSDLMGRVIGLMLTEVDPMTIDRIAEALSVTRTPVNDVLKRLENHGLVKRVWIKGNRKHHFTISTGVFHQAGTNLAAQFKDNLDISKRYLSGYLKKYQSANGEEKSKIKKICERFISMHEFHKASMDSYNSFLKDWKDKESFLPDVDELTTKGIIE